MTAPRKTIVTVGGQQFTVWAGPAGVTEVTKDAPRTRMGFRRVSLTSKNAKAAIAAAEGAAS
ncbi:hypothetical protein [Variovorax sp. 160MFSha2.1]|uniref:hypothetical protein n=1 Tax=Variovorax sp. 160MFSha2.1 TaxID=3158367 RepID=UPI003AAC9DD7